MDKTELAPRRGPIFLFLCSEYTKCGEPFAPATPTYTGQLMLRWSRWGVVGVVGIYRILLINKIWHNARLKLLQIMAIGLSRFAILGDRNPPKLSKVAESAPRHNTRG